MWMTRVAINNPVFAAMVMVALCVLGLFSYGKLGVEQMPDISFPGAWMEVRYPGASPEAVERELIKPMEEAVNSVAGVKRITSRSGEGLRAAMSVEFALDTDMNRAMQEIRDRIAAVQAGFPRDARPPTIARFNNDNSEPVVNMAPVGLCPAPPARPPAPRAACPRAARANSPSWATSWWASGCSASKAWRVWTSRA
jgi:multidrug efflux pump subunit AcrB